MRHLDVMSHVYQRSIFFICKILDVLVELIYLLKTPSMGLQVSALFSKKMFGN